MRHTLSHKNRSARRANEARRRAAAMKQVPLPIEKQLERAAAKEAERLTLERVGYRDIPEIKVRVRRAARVGLEHLGLFGILAFQRMRQLVYRPEKKWHHTTGS